jgi:uncharacterized membrane protein
MEMWLPILFSIVMILVAGSIVLALPKITRKGLLFGFYVGEALARGDGAARITHSWYRCMGLALFACAGAAAVMVAWGKPLAAIILPDAVLLLGLGRCYYVAHRAARELAASAGSVVPPPPSVASLSPSQPSLALPILVLAIGLLAGAATVWYAWSNYPALPERVPTHFTGSGKPDAWSDKSFASVMVLPLGALFTGAGMGALACFMAKSKRALRLKGGDVSLAAQRRFRTAMVALISVEGLIVTAMLCVMSIDSIRVGLGIVEGQSMLSMYLAGALLLFTIIAIIYIAARLGQGGSKLEASVADSPLTDGLADNEKWRMGLFYYNPDDPSIFVEHRFGLGYTLNFANSKGVAFLVLFFALVVVLPLILVGLQ